MIEVLSLGAGVQSSTVLLMSIRGELPKLDHAIFADTGYEPQAVYKHFEWLRAQAEAAGIAVHVVGNKSIHEDLMAQDGRWVSPPLFLKHPDGSIGIGRRQCTKEYKIEPIQKKLRELMGLKPRQRGPKEKALRQWFGISFDEASRMRTVSETRWIENWHPLIEAFTPPMSRWDCYKWLDKNGYPEPPKSACVCCPFRADYEWSRMKRESPAEFDSACLVDEAIRDRCSKPGPANYRNEVFLHRSGKPLREVDFQDDSDAPTLFNNDCFGMCGV